MLLHKGGLRRKIKMKTDKGYKKTRKSHNILSHAHELTFSCFNNRQFLKYDITRDFFLDALDEMVEYIHRNPVRRGLVDDPLKWEWSSAREWEEPGSGLIRINRESFPVIHKSR